MKLPLVERLTDVPAIGLKCYRFSFLCQRVNSFFEVLQRVWRVLRSEFRLGITRAAGRVRLIEAGTGICLRRDQPKATRLARCGLWWTSHLRLPLCLLRSLNCPLELLRFAVV